jgi:hypothetical protein
MQARVAMSIAGHDLAGSSVRERSDLVPSEAGATAARHRGYQVVSSDEAGTGQERRVGAVWPKVGGR